MCEEIEQGRQSTTAAGSTNLYRHYVEFLIFFVKVIWQKYLKYEQRAVRSLEYKVCLISVRFFIYYNGQ